jgi:hypothetical protein
MGVKRNTCGLLMGKPEGKRLLGRPSRMDLGEVGVMQTGLIWLKIGTGGELL